MVEQINQEVRWEEHEIKAVCSRGQLVTQALWNKEEWGIEHPLNGRSFRSWWLVLNEVQEAHCVVVEGPHRKCCFPFAGPAPEARAPQTPQTGTEIQAHLQIVGKGPEWALGRIRKALWDARVLVQSTLVCRQN